MRTEQITAKAMKYLGDDRYKLCLVVAKRAEELAAGAQPLILLKDPKMKYVDIAMLEVAEGKIGLDCLADRE